jgi:hypothetical protein
MAHGSTHALFITNMKKFYHLRCHGGGCMFDKLGGARELPKNEMLGFGARYHTPPCTSHCRILKAEKPMPSVHFQSVITMPAQTSFSPWEQAEMQRHHHPGFCNTKGFFFISAMKEA